MCLIGTVRLLLQVTPRDSINHSSDAAECLINLSWSWRDLCQGPTQPNDQNIQVQEVFGCDQLLLKPPPVD